jgi:thymidylate synthase (FAD)
MVKLVSITKPVIEGINTPEDLISYCARVSNPENQMSTETAPRLIKYLIKHKHWSPFEMVSATFEIKTSRAIAAQILRHRSFSFQEFSQRYSMATEFEKFELRKQGKTNRQVGEDLIDFGDYVEMVEEVETLQLACQNLYKKLLDKGVARECARMVLPLSTSTTLYMSGTIRSWIHYIDLRTSKDTQTDHREIADRIQDILIKELPVISEALEWKSNIYYKLCQDQEK